MMRAECQRCRELMDSYVSNELLIETNLEVLRHLEDCANCHAHADARRGTRDLLRDRIREERAPQALHDRITSAIANADQARAHSKSRGWPFMRSLLGAAAVLFVLLLLAPGARAWMADVARVVIGAVIDRSADHGSTLAPPASSPVAMPAPPTAPVESRPLDTGAPTGLAPKPVDLTLLEVETLARLDSVGALLGGQIEVARSTSRVVVRGLVEDEAKRQTITKALSSLGSRSLRVEIRTVSERLQQLPQPSGALQFKSLEFEANGIPTASDLRSYLTRVGAATDVEAEVRRIATTALRHSRTALLHALAVESIAERYEPKALRQANPKAYEVWLRLLASHGAAFAEEMRKLRTELEPAFLPLSPPMGDINTNEALDSAETAARLGRLAVTIDEAIRAGLTVSSEPVERLQIRDLEFWRTVRRAERLARALAK